MVRLLSIKVNCNHSCLLSDKLGGMITTSHVIYNWALGERLANSRFKQTLNTKGLVFGGFLPDCPTYLFFIVQGLILQTSQQELWDTLYFDSVWSPFITLSHSLIIWPLLLALSYATTRSVLFSISLGALFHIIVDFFVHAKDAYRHFWPLSDWQWHSPISYWDPSYYGNIISLVDALVILFLLGYLYTKIRNKWLLRSIILCGIFYLLLIITLLV